MGLQASKKKNLYKFERERKRERAGKKQKRRELQAGSPFK